MLGAVLLAGCSGASAGATTGDEADQTSTTNWYISASTVEAMRGSLASVTPKIHPASNGFDDPESFLSQDSALGPAGPLSAWGPLGALGPIGDNSWNTSAWMSGAGDFTNFTKAPVSEDGPLGPKGPLADKPYSQDLPAINDFGKQLQAGGVWTALGPIGALGALGPLGPLGPVGSFASVADRDGNYKKKGQIVRTVDVPYDGETRTYGLVENYTEDAAKKITDNDTSFMVHGDIEDPGHETDEYAFASPEAQYLTITLVPENALSDFDVELADSRGHVVASSRSDGSQSLLGVLPVNEGHYIDFIQLRVTEGAKFTARVTAKTAPVTSGYRLIVVGSTKHIPESDIHGKHQAALK
jgi:hypothetical protein